MPALGLDFERSLRTQPAEVRRAISAALRDAGFELTAEQLTRVEAKRGSRWFSGTLMPAKTMPILAWFDIAAEPGGCSVAGHFADQHINVGGKAWGWNQTYRQLFGEVLVAIDRALARLDADAAGSFAPARFWTKGGEIAVLEQAQEIGAHAGAAVFDKANEVLEGGSRDRGPAAWKGVDSVTFSSPKGLAVLSLAETQAHLGVGVMIASQQGALPPKLQREVEQFAARVEEALTNAPGRALAIPVAVAEQPVFEFLHQQVRIRDGLPVRTLHTCRTCHFQRVTNEDFERLQARNQRLRSLVGGVGATISSGGIQPFVVLGQLFRLKKLDPDYVCPRCQGLDADERVITFCPSCGEMRSEVVLRVCGKCKHDLRSTLTAETLWLTAEAAAALVAPPVAAQPVWQAQAGSGSPPVPPPADGGWVVPPAAASAPGGGWVAGSSPAVAAPPADGGWVVPPAPVAPAPVASAPGLPAAAAIWGSPASPATAAWPAPNPVNPPVGLPIAPVEPAAPAAGSIAFCPFCGTRAGPEFAFCPTCGTRLDSLIPNPGGPTG